MDLRKLKTLIDLVSESNISELEITEAEGKVRIVKAGASAAVAQPGSVARAAAPAPSEANSRRLRTNSAFSASVISSHIADSPRSVRLRE